MDNKAKITGCRYVLAVKDLKKSAEFYQNQLGFSTIWNDDNWHFMKREKFLVMLGECADDRSAFETNNHSYFGYIEVEHIDSLFEEYSSKEIEILRQPEDQPWGQREFAIRTIDGHRIMFGQEI